MIPKIEFRYSWIYDEGYRNSSRIRDMLKEKNRVYPSKRKIENYIAAITPLWGGIEKRTLGELSKISGLKWKENRIRCYVIGFCRPFSDPLTMKLYPNKKDFVDTLTHEMIHQIQIQNKEKIGKWFDNITSNYGKETRVTRNHIFVHAVHSKLYLALFDEKRLNRNIRRDKENPDYYRAWEIVRKEGYQKIIDEFRGMIK